MPSVRSKLLLNSFCASSSPVASIGPVIGDIDQAVVPSKPSVMSPMPATVVFVKLLFGRAAYISTAPLMPLAGIVSVPFTATELCACSALRPPIASMCLSMMLCADGSAAVSAGFCAAAAGGAARGRLRPARATR